MYIVAIAKQLNHYKLLLLINYLFCIILSIRPIGLIVEFVADNIKLILSMSNVNSIVDTKLQPNNSFHSLNQTK